MNDIKFAIRQFAKSPGFTLIAVLSLALGIGANTTVASWISEVLLHPIPGAKNADRMVVIAGRHASGAINDTISYLDLQDLGAEKDLFDGVIASQMGTVALGKTGETEWAWAQVATANYFGVLGAEPALGRGFLPDEELGRVGAAVAVISQGLWQRRFGGDPHVVGRTIELNQQPFTIVGIAPETFRGTMGGLRFDLWIPLSQSRLLNFADEKLLTTRDERALHCMARLKPGVSIKAAQIAADTVMRRLESEYPNTNRNQGVAVFPLWASPYGGQAPLLPLLRVLLGVAFLVFLLVVANLANLLLARATARRREVAVRLAVGASRVRLIRQLLTESLLLAALGGGAGILFAAWSLGLLTKLLPTTYLPIGYELHLSWPVIVFTGGFAIFAAVLFGIVPAWQSGNVDLNTSLKEGGRAGSGHGASHRLRNILVVVEVALALMLLVAAGLCLKSFQVARRANPGFRTDGVWLAGFRLKAHGYDDEKGGRYFQELRRRLTEASGVEAAAMADWLPLGFEGGSTTTVRVEGYVPAPNERMNVGESRVSPDYFKTLRTPLMDGRDFGDRDDRDAPTVAVVNEAFVKRYLQGRKPIGHKIHFWTHDATIVGVVGDAKYRSLSEPAQPFLYICAWQEPAAHLTAVVRMKGDAADGARLIAREAASVDAAVKVWVSTSFVNFTEAAFAVQRIAAELLLVLGVVSILLAAMGIYGVIAFSVNQRVREIGIRMALGARRADVKRLILRQGLMLAAAGCVVGLVGSALAGRLMANLLIGVGWFEPSIVCGVVFGLMAVAALACWFPARRAAGVDPMLALRAE